MSADDDPLVSIVIPTFNSSKTIGKTLQSIAAQTWKNVEVIVVDRFSTDDTIELASDYPNVRTYSTGPERSSQLNLAAKVARGSYIYRIDSDFVVEPTVVEEAVKACEQGADAVLIHNTSDPTVSFWSKVRKVERDTLVDDWEHVAVRFMKKSVFDSVGGFNEALFAEEDRDLHNRIVAAGFKISRIEAKETHLGEPRSITEIARKYAYYGKSVREYTNQNGVMAAFKLGPFRRAFVRHRQAIAENPTLLVGFFLYEYVMYASAIAGFLTGSGVTQAKASRGAHLPLRIRPESLQTAPHGEAQVSMVVVTRNRPNELRRCLDSIGQSRIKPREVIVVDDSSDEPIIVGPTEQIERVEVLRNEGRMYLAASRNRGARASKGEFVFFVDDDNELDGDAVGELVRALGENSTAVASPTICYRKEPDTVWFAGGRITPYSGLFVSPWRGRKASSLPDSPYQTGVFHDAFMVRRDVFERAGFFDDVGFPMYLGEADWAARLAECGFSSMVVPRARVWHEIASISGASSLLRSIHITEPVRAYFVGRNRFLYMRKHRRPEIFLFHVILFEPVIIAIHTFAVLMGDAKVKKTHLLGAYIRGVLDGLSGRVRMGSKLLSTVPA